MNRRNLVVGAAATGAAFLLGKGVDAASMMEYNDVRLVEIGLVDKPIHPSMRALEKDTSVDLKAFRARHWKDDTGYTTRYSHGFLLFDPATDPQWLGIQTYDFDQEKYVLHHIDWRSVKDDYDLQSAIYTLNADLGYAGCQRTRTSTRNDCKWNAQARAFVENYRDQFDFSTLFFKENHRRYGWSGVVGLETFDKQSRIWYENSLRYQGDYGVNDLDESRLLANLVRYEQFLSRRS